MTELRKIKKELKEEFGNLKDFLKYGLNELEGDSDWTREYENGERYVANDSSPIKGQTCFRTKKEAAEMFRNMKNERLQELIAKYSKERADAKIREINNCVEVLCECDCGEEYWIELKSENEMSDGSYSIDYHCSECGEDRQYNFENSIYKVCECCNQIYDVQDNYSEIAQSSLYICNSCWDED